MINVTIMDGFGNSCELDDVIVVHNRNECIKYFGVLRFENMQFIISDLSGGWHQLPPLKHQTLERLCPLATCPHIEKELGRVEVEKPEEFDKILNLINQC